MLRRLLVALALLGFIQSPGAQGIGSTLPKSALGEFRLTDATSLDDYYGQAVLLEFFAHW